MAVDYNERVRALRGKRVRVTIYQCAADDEEAYAQIRMFRGTVSGAVGLGREVFVVLDNGEVFLAASRTISIEVVHG